MYSLHGLLALILPSVGHVCHSLTVVSNCTPGSAQLQAAKAIWSQRSRAFMVLEGFGSRFSLRAFSFSVRQKSGHGPSSWTAFMNSLVIRTELFEFWPETVKYAFEFQSVSYSSTSIDVNPWWASWMTRAM